MRLLMQKHVHGLQERFYNNIEISNFLETV